MNELFHSVSTNIHVKIELITIGDELLIGQTIDTNTSNIGGILNSHGFSLSRSTSIYDQRTEILGALKESTERSDVVLITGGLGPTNDDITKETLAEFYNCGQRQFPEILEQIQKMVGSRAKNIAELLKLQSQLPDICVPLVNNVGTAPGMLFDRDGKLVISMPGVPYEVEYLMNERIMPILLKQGLPETIIHKTFLTVNVTESRLSILLAKFEEGLVPEIKLAYLPTLNTVKLRLTAKGAAEGLLKAKMDEASELLHQSLGDVIVSDSTVHLEEVIYKLLQERNQTLALAESCTGGYLSHLFTKLPGISKYFKGSIVAYDYSVKTDVLGVDNDILIKYGAVSTETVEIMAKNTLANLKSDFAIAISGIAGPGGGTPDKPVGTVYVAVASKDQISTRRYQFKGSRTQIIFKTSISAMQMLRNLMLNNSK